MSRHIRLRWSRTTPGHWSLTLIERSRWPLPRPYGMSLYVMRFLVWNVVAEVTQDDRASVLARLRARAHRLTRRG